MENEQNPPNDDALTTCTVCGAPLGQNVMPPQSAALFCSRSCEIEGNFWLFQEMSAIQVTNPPHHGQDARDML